jgi:hypothetical protein
VLTDCEGLQTIVDRFTRECLALEVDTSAFRSRGMAERQVDAIATHQSMMAFLERQHAVISQPCGSAAGSVARIVKAVW